MKKEILVKMSIEDDDDRFPNDDLIKDDLETEIGCCSWFYDIEDIIIKDIELVR